MGNKSEISYAALLGEFIGTLKGICHWNIHEDLEKKLQLKIKKLEKLETNGK